jgi:fructose-1,6-bisphosphatase/inositol monophosphatase family enzyme
VEALLDAEDIRRTGSAALDLAYVACGRAAPTSNPA